ncbi:Rad2 nuclease [Mucor velutinosus]|uniref:Rad2 nuclease n=1 Tax=Mucor velutinosus TaxID=708070 RepID=A0AAN7HYG0_9FUNG|nr:Rad2 nuclease [Mucor velutinosus]
MEYRYWNRDVPACMNMICILQALRATGNRPPELQPPRQLIQMVQNIKTAVMCYASLTASIASVEVCSLLNIIYV